MMRQARTWYRTGDCTYELERLSDPRASGDTPIFKICLDETAEREKEKTKATEPQPNCYPTQVSLVSIPLLPVCKSYTYMVLETGNSTATPVVSNLRSEPYRAGARGLRVFTFHLLDSLLTATTNISICPHMTSYSNTWQEVQYE
jgi:hypothetical protein